MKRTIFVIFVFLYACQAFAQLTVDWQQTYPTFPTNAFQPSGSGGYILAGGEYIFKTDANGNVIAQQQIVVTGATSPKINSIEKTSEGKYILAGSINDAFVDRNALYILIDDNLNIEWSKTYRLHPDEFGGDILNHGLQTADGGYTLVGDTDYWLCDICHDDWGLNLTVDAAGDVSSAAIMGTSGGYGDEAFHVVQAGNGDLFIAGTNWEDSEGWLGRARQDGSKEFYTYHYTNGLAPNVETSSSLYVVQNTQDGNLICGGYVEDWDPGLGETVSAHIWLLKTNKNGVIKWQRLLGDNKLQWFRGVRPTADGGYIVIAASSGETLIIKVDAYGTKLWEYSLQGTTSAAPEWIVETAPYEYVLCGRKDGQGWLVKFHQDETLLPPTPVEPMAGKQGIGIDLWFNWTSCCSGVEYQIQVARDADFNQVITKDYFVSTNRCFVSDLAYNTTYYWRVAAKKGAIQSDWSETFTFTTMAQPPVVFHSPARYVFSYMGIQEQYYIDREYIVSDIPQQLDHLLWVKTANDHKSNSDNNFFTCQLEADATIYVAYDSRATSLPNWLSGEFQDTGQIIRVSDEMEQFNVFQKAFPAGPVVLGGNMAPGAAGAKSNYIVLIDVGGCQFVNEEFNQDSYCGFSLLIPKDGPTVGLLANPGFCRFYLPGNTKFDHWSTVNDAPRLRRAVPSDMDWSVETSLTLQNTTGSKMAAGLVIIFSEHDMLYWGFVGSSNMLNARQTRTVILSNIAYGGGNTVELLIRKQGSEYFFAYRPPGAQTWIEAGSRAVNKPPVHAGLMVKTWQTAAVTADFDYFRLMFADPLNIITDFLPGGVKGTAYNAQLQAGGGVPPYTWSETGNNLPAGLSLNAAGTISGTPAVAGTATITVQVADNAVPPNTATKQLDITITDDGTGIDEEFITGNLDGYTVYVPVPGPQWDALSVTDYLRLFIPATQNYDHWNNKDDAPQLRRDVPAGSDWSVETQTQLMAYPASGFHTGLLVYFDRFDLFYWGFNSSNTRIMLSRSGTGKIIVINNYNGGDAVQLRIRKQGNTYFFDYKAPGAGTWTNAGTQTVVQTPQSVGLIGKTFQKQELEVYFDYLRLQGAETGLQINTASLPNGVVGTLYNVQLQASGGTPPYAWALTGGTLPAGLALNAAGQITGTPTVAATVQVTVQVTDNAVPPNTTNRQLDLSVTAGGGGIDEEFVTGNLDGYTQYVPVPGPVWDPLSVNDWLRLYIPASRNFDHWNNKDDAPQLRRNIGQQDDWSVETLAQLITIPAGGFHTGLMVYFGQFDIFYWGFNGNTGRLMLSRSGQGKIIVVNNYNGGNGVELRIRKLGNDYYFDYRAPGAETWTNAGIQSVVQQPTAIGLIGKTFSRVELEIHFDYLRLQVQPAQNRYDHTTNDDQPDLYKTPGSFSISECYPNPFNPSTRLTINMTENKQVTAVIFNLKGQKVKTAFEGTLGPGQHDILWNAKDDAGTTVNSGIYYMRIRVGEAVYSRKLMFLK